MSERRVLDTNANRAYAGERPAKGLVSYLNSTQEANSAGKRRVKAIMETYRQILALLEKHPPSTWKKPSGKELGLLAEPPGFKNFRQTPEGLATLKESLLNQVYRYERRLTFGITASKGGDFSWGMTTSKDVDWDKEEWEVSSEATAVDAIVELSREGLLAKVQKCECGTWFFARFSHQRFCGNRCKGRHQQASPEFKAMRRAYMRKYYRLQKKNVK